MITGVTHFTQNEFSNHIRMNEWLVKRLDLLREMVQLPIYVTSSFRGGDPGAHGDGDAVDISDNLQSKKLSSTWRFRVLRAAFQLGFTRVGVYDKHIHLDLSQRLDQEVCWYGASE